MGSGMAWSKKGQKKYVESTFKGAADNASRIHQAATANGCYWA